MSVLISHPQDRTCGQILYLVGTPWFPGKRRRTWRTSEWRVDLLTKIGSAMWRLSLDSWTEHSRGRRHHDALPMSECLGCQVTGCGVITEAILLLHELWTPRRRTMSQIPSKGNMTSEESSGLHYWIDKEQTDRVAVKTQQSQADDILRHRDACIAEVRPEVKRIGALPSIRCHGRDGEVSHLGANTDFFVAVRFDVDLDGRLQLRQEKLLQQTVSSVEELWSGPEVVRSERSIGDDHRWGVCGTHGKSERYSMRLAKTASKMVTFGGTVVTCPIS